MDVNFPGELQLLVGPPNFAPATGMESSEPQTQLYAAEIAQAHANRLALGKQLKSGKGTDAAYKQHIKAYEKFFRDYHPTVNPHPIVPFKAALFLEYERKRNKVWLIIVIFSAIFHTQKMHRETAKARRRMEPRSEKNT